jgi:hypothetical protein
MSLTLSKPQHIFLNELDTKFRAYVGGFGSGKTFVGCFDLLLFALKHPGVVQGYFAPSYVDIRDTFYPTFEEAADLLGLNVIIKTGNKEVEIYDSAGRYYGRIICRSLDNPYSIKGFKIARALIDELDRLETKKAMLAWRQIMARMRLVIPGVVNSVGLTTTPEGYKAVYQLFKKNPKADYSMVQASTYENIKYLPEDYIQSLYDNYPKQLVEAYINGDFVNLESGSIYHAYNRVLNASEEVVKEGEPLFIGMDFNVQHMAAIVYVKRNDENGNITFHAVDELMNYFDTPAMIETIKERYETNYVNVYPDASGNNRKSVNASETDISLLEDAGFEIHTDGRNPFVKDRILSANNAFEKRKVMVNVNKCPEYADCLEQQVYMDNGEPDKKSGFDHANDAGTYLIVYELPIIRPVANLRIKMF